jgi:hypothetical protein
VMGLCYVGFHRPARFDLTGYGPHMGCKDCGMFLGYLLPPWDDPKKDEK